MAHTLGSAMAVLGAALLLTRIPTLTRLLHPLATAGAMALTLYSTHLLVLTADVGDDHPALLYLLMVTGALAFALLWQRRFGQGPLERIRKVRAERTMVFGVLVMLGRRRAVCGVAVMVRWCAGVICCRGGWRGRRGWVGG